MGTRADFYIGRGENAEWLGSIGWDGNPYGLPERLLAASTEDDFKAAFHAYIASRDDFTSPDMGWPWPWNDSRTTDYAYAFDDGKVWASCFGGKWFEAAGEQPEDDEEKTSVFPDMKDRKNVTLGERSGVIIIGA